MRTVTLKEGRGNLIYEGLVDEAEKKCQFEDLSVNRNMMSR